MGPQSSPDRDAVAAAADQVARGGVVAMTGAGVSDESGIPDFRSAAGLWTRFDPMEYATADAFRRDPDKVWQMFFEVDDLVHGAAPNPAHTALAELEAMGVLSGVITQNIDNLHQTSGSRHVVEFHGSAARLVCLSCGARYASVDRPAKRPEPPECGECGSVLKPDVVLFGDPIPEPAIEEALRLAQGCQTMIVAGTSALVSPASEIPLVARQAGAALVEVNLERTPLSSYAAHRLVGKASQTLPALVAAVREWKGAWV